MHHQVQDQIWCVNAAQGPEIMVSWLQDMYLWLGFSPKWEQSLAISDRLHVLIDKNVNGIFNVVKKPGSKNANRMLDRGQQVSVIAQENLKLAAFLFHHRGRFTFDWEVTEVHEDMVYLQAGQKRLEDYYKDQDLLP